MAPSATSPPPPRSATQTLLSSLKSPSTTYHPTYLYNLAQITLHNLQHQHDWTTLSIHTHSPLSGSPLPRPVIGGLPPKRAYVHPDEQIAVLKAAHDASKGEHGAGAGEGEDGEGKVEGQKEVGVNSLKPEMEWVLPTQVSEKWTLKALAGVFDALPVVPPTTPYSPSNTDGGLGRGKEEVEGDAEKEVGWEWRGKNRQKRVLLATVNDDSTVVYYIVHDGLVKPRQN